jgi:CheY-like chemotaxis protein
MDVQMPVCDGIQATKRIREHNTSIPIIGLTANVFQQEVDICLDAGMNDHMGKPYTEEQLYVSIKKWLFINEQHSFVPPVSYCNFDFIESVTKNNTPAFREMLDTFLNQNSKLAIEIETALLNADMHTLSFSLHQYKSCVRILGIEKQTNLISEIEKKIRAGYSFDALNHQIKNLVEIAHAVDKEITFKIKSL